MIELPKRKRRWFQFSLRSLMIVVTVVVLLCGGVVKWRTRIEKQEAEHQRAKRELEKGGGVHPIIQDFASFP